MGSVPDLFPSDCFNLGKGFFMMWDVSQENFKILGWETRVRTLRIIVLFSIVILLTVNLAMAAGKPTIKKFKVDYLRQGDNLIVKVITDLPNNVNLSVGCEKAGLKDYDLWIGTLLIMAPTMKNQW